MRHHPYHPRPLLLQEGDFLKPLDSAGGEWLTQQITLVPLMSSTEYWWGNTVPSFQDL